MKNSATNSLKENNLHTPVFYRLNNEKDAAALQQLLHQNTHIRVYNTLASQLKELVKSRTPSRTLTTAEIEAGIKHILNDTDADAYGVWVYYPWSSRLVHILDEAEFIELRTDRNRYKITLAERELLAKKKVGVIGLSVGQSVSLTLAMERTFGELRIADFDELEITNLNRLRSGVHNMGLKKTVMVAREIAEIDPFLKVTCFHEGITAENMDTFLLGNGKLDVLIDECDGVDIKINCRIAAKKHQIPVLMEASDRGTIDMERFDLEPNRPILHGYVEHLDISRVKELKTNEEKLPFILPIVGIETMSVRLKASAVEVGKTISTWPQLASAVTFGGGVTADICRRMLLDQLRQSGRYFLDLDELISDPVKPAPVLDDYAGITPLTQQQMAELAAQVTVPATATPVTGDEARQLVEAAALAPSAGNNQPWKWYFNKGSLLLFHEASRSASFADVDNMASYVALGTALENIALKAGAIGLKAGVQLFPLQHQPQNPVALVHFTREQQPADELVNYIATRYTNRNNGSGKTIDTAVFDAMQAAISKVPGAQLHVLHTTEQVAAMADIIGPSEKLRLFIPQGHYDLFARELRTTVEEAEATRDGLDMRTLSLTALEAIGLRVSRDYRALDLLDQWNLGSAMETMARKGVTSAAAVGVVTMPGFTGEDFINAGRAVERIWLTASRSGLSMQPMLAPLFHFARLNHHHGKGMADHIQRQFAALQANFRKLVNTQSEPVFMFRLFYGDEPLVKSLRLNLDDIYIQ
ncbi:Rv1355c family protein [Deminuibacter soli]|uniref:Rv1355c family protein n=1 Tax=Deminuibacter soli TaxID=2291815 RepID=UPI001314FDD8|nr:Rv1355c family protein [Deminuibacter soli]